MTILQTFDEIKTEENSLFGIEIKEFLLRYVHEGKEEVISTKDLKNFYSVRIMGMNDSEENKKPKKTKSLCNGCRQDWYNYNRAGRVVKDGEECFSYKDANVIKKDVHYSIHTVNPVKEWRLECFNYKRT